MPESDETSEPRFTGALTIRMEESSDAEIVVGQETLQVSGPFGELTIPFAQVTKAADVPGEALSVEAGRLKLSLQLRTSAERAFLKFLINNRMAAARRR